jgi:uncharacterized Zn finger protein
MVHNYCTFNNSVWNGQIKYSTDLCSAEVQEMFESTWKEQAYTYCKMCGHVVEYSLETYSARAGVRTLW